jgi:hypothetical protein
MKAWLLFPLSLTLPGCLADYGLAYDELHVSATLEDGTTPVATTPANGCTTLPLLLGSRVERSIGIGNEIDAEVSATRDRVRVEFRGVVFAEGRTVLAEDLQNGFDSGPIMLDSNSGTRVIVRLSGDCPSTDASTN